MTTDGRSTFSSAMEDAKNYSRWLADYCRQHVGRSFLEVGVGHGDYFELFPTAESYIGVDIDRDLVEASAQKNPKGEYITADVTDGDAIQELKSRQIDTVICFNVIEHIEEDHLAVSNMIDVLAPGGHLLLLVPAHSFLYTDLDRLAGHLRRYTLRAVKDLIPVSAEILKLRYFNPIGGVGWWLNGLVRHDSLESTAVKSQVKTFDRFVLPISRLADPLTRRFFGQSVFGIVRKP